MARRLRHFERGTLYEIAIRTDRGRFALAPKEDLISVPYEFIDDAGFDIA